MAEYDIIGRVQTREVRGTKLVKVREFQVMSLPSETYFEFRRDPSQACYSQPGICAQQFADRIEAVIANDLVVDVAYSQDTTAAGRLVGFMTTFFESEDGRVQGSVEQPLSAFGPGTTIPKVEAALAELGGA